MTYLQHDETYLIDALGDLLSTAAQGNRSLRRVWQHFTGHLNGAACGLANFLDFRATLACRPATAKVRNCELVFSNVFSFSPPTN